MAATPTKDLGFQNFFQATLTGDITASSTDIPMDNIPNSSQGFLVIEPDSSTNREVIFYTSKTALKFVCPSAADGRGQDDTTAVAHSTGATVIMSPVAAFYEALQSGQSMSDDSIASRHIQDEAVLGENLGTPVAFFVRRTTDQTLVTSSITKVQFATEVYDLGNNFDSTTDYEFTAPYDGIYHFDGHGSIDAAGSQCLGYIYVNGTNVAMDNNYNNAATDDMNARVSATLQLSAGDTVDYRMHHNAGANRSLLGTSTGQNYFCGFLVGRT